MCLNSEVNLLMRCCIAIYLIYFMALTSLTVAVSVLVLKIHHMSPSYEVPGWVRRLVLGHLSSLVRMDTTNRVTFRHIDSGDSSAPNEKIWAISSHRVCGDLEADNGHPATGTSIQLLAPTKFDQILAESEIM